MRITSKAAFISSDSFKAVTHVLPEEIKAPTIRLQKPDGGVVEGIMVLPNTVPAELPHYDLEFYFENLRAHDDWLLIHDQQLRAPQAKERFELAVGNMGQTNMLSKVAKLEPYSKHQQAAKEHQEAADLAVHGAQAGDAVAPAAITSQTRSGLQEEGGLMPPPDYSEEKEALRQRARCKHKW